MLIKCVGVIDSGVGGLTVLKRLKEKLPQFDYVYYGDSQNVPYGNKSERELFSLSYRLALAVIEKGAQCIVLGCTTLSLTVLNKLRQVLSVPVFGVFPPVERSLINGGRVLLLATERTCEKIPTVSGLTKIPLLSLATLIEKNKFALDKVCINDIKELCIKLPYFDTVILGCTHYELLLPVLKARFTNSRIIIGADDTVKMLQKSLISEGNTLNLNSGLRGGEIIFLGRSSAEICNFWQKVVFKT